LITAGCGGSTDDVMSGSAATSSTGPPGTPSATTTTGEGTETTSAATAAEPATTAEPAAVTTAAPISVPDDGPCDLTGMGERTSAITFTSGGRLYQLEPDGTTQTCLADLSAAPATSLSWSPSGGAVLLDGSRVLDASGTRQTGYRPDNAGVEWSYPTGKALIAPALSDGALLWRAAGDPGSRLDISFLAHTDVAVYHPAGKNVFAVGVDSTGTPGVYVASNRGQNMKRVAVVNDPATKITELAADVSGARLYLLHDEGTKWEIHSVVFPSLQLTTVFDSAQPLSRLTLGSGPDSPVAAQVGTCPGDTHTIVATWGTTTVGTGTPLASMSTAPIGWLDSDHLVVAARAHGCSGPASVWVARGDGSAQQVLTSVEDVAVRSVLGPFGELPGDINSQAPG
jgi:hypothetical protein